jgi:hypothetical protein
LTKWLYKVKPQGAARGSGDEELRDGTYHLSSKWIKSRMWIGHFQAADGHFQTNDRLIFWSHILDLARRRGRLAAAATMEELRDGNYELDEISSEKRAIMYTQVRKGETRSPKPDARNPKPPLEPEILNST